MSLAGIHMSDIPSFEYGVLWQERTLRSVANMTRRDAQEFMELAAEAGIRVADEVYPLEDANDALAAIASDAVPAPRCCRWPSSRASLAPRRGTAMSTGRAFSGRSCRVPVQ